MDFFILLFFDKKWKRKAPTHQLCFMANQE